jgi:hypothetical protein
MRKIIGGLKLLGAWMVKLYAWDTMTSKGLVRGDDDFF